MPKTINIVFIGGNYRFIFRIIIYIDFLRSSYIDFLILLTEIWGELLLTWMIKNTERYLQMKPADILLSVDYSEKGMTNIAI